MMYIAVDHVGLYSSEMSYVIINGRLCCAVLFKIARDAPILPANFLEKYIGKSKEQNAGKIGGKLEKWAPRNCSLAHFV